MTIQHPAGRGPLRQTSSRPALRSETPGHPFVEGTGKRARPKKRVAHAVAAFDVTQGSAALQNLDRLWATRDAAGIVDAIATLVGPLRGQIFEGLDGNTLFSLATQLFVLERRLGTVLNQLSLVDAPADKRRALVLQQQLANIQTSVFRGAVALQDAADANPVGPWVVHLDTQKKAGFHSPDEQEAYFLKKLREFIAKGGDPTQIRALDGDFLAELRSGELCEYVVDAVDVPRAATVIPGKPSPGHTLLARGGGALSAGTFTVMKNARGEITQVIVGTFSGHFRSGIEAQHHLVRHLVAAGVPRELIIQREGQAGNPRTPEILGRVLGIEGAEVQRREQAMLALAGSWEGAAQILDGDEEPSKKTPAGDKGGSDKPVSDKQKAERAERAAQRLRLADVLMRMRMVVSKSIEDGIIGSGPGSAGGDTEVNQVVAAVDEALRTAQAAGNPLAYGQAMALLRHLASLKEPHVDAKGALALSTLYSRWRAHEFGKVQLGPDGAPLFDPADLFGPRPVQDRRARICATINPSATPERIREMILAGMNVARINTAHGSIAQQHKLVERVRAVSASLGVPVTVQIDLVGPKLRLGRFENPTKQSFNDITLVTGEDVTLTAADVLGTSKVIPLLYPALTADVKVGDPILMSDGTVELTVKAVNADGTLTAQVKAGGAIWARKGVNLPGSSLTVRTLTDEDVKVLTKLLPHVDLVAAPFVRSPDDIVLLRAKMQALGRVVPIIAKIERREAVAELERIALVSDALMVSRGELGVEVGYENVPTMERRINAVGKLYGKPTLVATEVLMSMIDDPSRPSRGDVEGLYAAIHDRGADAIVLGKETSYPDHPDDVIRAASRVIEHAEEQRLKAGYSLTPDETAQGGNPLEARIPTAEAIRASQEGAAVEEPATPAAADAPSALDERILQRIERTGRVAQVVTITPPPPLLKDWSSATLRADARDQARIEAWPEVELALDLAQQEKGRTLDDAEREAAIADFFSKNKTRVDGLIGRHLLQMTRAVKARDRVVAELAQAARPQVALKRDPFSRLNDLPPSERGQERMLYEDERAMVLVDLFAPSPQVLVVPREGIMFPTDAPPDLLDHLARLAAVVSDALMLDGGAGGSSAMWINPPQDVTLRQLHVHVDPRLPEWLAGEPHVRALEDRALAPAIEDFWERVGAKVNAIVDAAPAAS